MKHYEFTGDTEIIFGVTLRRIKSKKTGELGGWIEKEANISGDAWVSGNAQVFGNAWVFGDAWEITPLCIHATRWSVSVSSKTTISIGCHTLTTADWDKNGEKIAKAENFSAAEREEYKLYLALCKAWMLIYCKD